MKVFASLFLALTCTGCMTAMMPKGPVHTQVPLAMPPAAAYGRASATMLSYGGLLRYTDAHQHRFTAEVHQAVLMSVVIEPATDGSVVHVTCSLLPNKLVLGGFTECDDYAALLRS